LRIWEGNRFSEFYLLAKLLSLDLSGIRDIRCPLIVFAGREDVNVNSYVAEEWFSTVTAPSKQFVWFENAAHLLMTEKPGQFLMSLVSDALPIARRAGDAPKVSS
jgi:pimeloyl-ACP methyl ester carboxylesterase